MAARITGSKKVFKYPIEFTTLPDYTAHNNCTVKVVRRLSEDEADRGGGLERMYEIVAEDGWKGHAFESELV